MAQEPSVGKMVCSIIPPPAWFRNGRVLLVGLAAFWVLTTQLRTCPLSITIMEASTGPGRGPAASIRADAPRTAVVTIFGDSREDRGCGMKLLRDIRTAGKYGGELLVLHPEAKFGDGVPRQRFVEVLREFSAVPVELSTDWSFVSNVGQSRERMIKLEIFVNPYFRQWNRLVFIDMNSVVLGPISSLLDVPLPAGRAIAMPDNHSNRKAASLHKIEYAPEMLPLAGPRPRDVRIGKASLMVIDLAQMAPPAEVLQQVKAEISSIGAHCLQGDQGIINAVWQDQITTMPTCCPAGDGTESFQCAIRSNDRGSFLEARNVGEESALRDAYCKHPAGLQHMVYHSHEQAGGTRPARARRRDAIVKGSCSTGGGCLQLAEEEKRQMSETSMSDDEIAEVLEDHAVDKTVWLAMTDSPPEFMPLIDNWICGMRRIGLEPLVWSLDVSTHLKVQQKGALSVYSKDFEVPKTAKAGQFKVPGSDEYMAVIAMKPRLATKILGWGFHLLFLDIDLGLAQDPRIWLSERSGADLQISSNYPQPFLNTGIWLARNTDQTRRMIAKWLERVVEHRCKGWECNDQDILTYLLAECGWKRPTTDKQTVQEWSRLTDNDRQHLSCSWTGQGALHIDMLPPRFFATGHDEGEKILNQERQSGKVVTYHPNFSGFREGTKQEKLQNMTIAGRKMWCPDGK
mmetsp:Transcript_119808/g.339573  ORF Transcript_119808/g.339573 Transcript_119808/m.339573 type:complete len:685 (-) Transcript_119808:316-2370(-)